MNFFFSDFHDNSCKTHVMINMVLGYLFGAAITMSLVTVAKYTLGRLRPHFFDVCNLNYSTIDCGTNEHPIYVTNYHCPGNSKIADDFIGSMEAIIEDAHISFVSGHSSYIFQAMTFLALYLQARLVNTGHFDSFLGKCSTISNLFLLKLMPIFAVPTIQMFGFGFAMWVAMTRITDHMHHPGDVIGGSLLGIMVSIINITVFMRLFKIRNEAKVDEYTSLL